MIHLIYNEAQHTLVSMETLHAIFPRYDIQKIRSDILACLNSQHFFIDEYSLTNLLLHMLITMDQLGTAPNAPRYEVSTDLIELNILCRSSTASAQNLSGNTASFSPAATSTSSPSCS